MPFPRAEFSAFIHSIGLSEFLPKFLVALEKLWAMSMEDLKIVTDQDLNEQGIPAIPRRKFLQAVAQLSCDADPTSSDLDYTEASDLPPAVKAGSTATPPTATTAPKVVVKPEQTPYINMPASGTGHDYENPDLEQPLRGSTARGSADVDEDGYEPVPDVRPRPVFAETAHVFPRDIGSWTNTDCIQWLKLNSLDKDFKSSFYSNGFTGEHLFLIHPPDYSKIGIAEDRIAELQAAIGRLKKKPPVLCTGKQPPTHASEPAPPTIPSTASPKPRSPPPAARSAPVAKKAYNDVAFAPQPAPVMPAGYPAPKPVESYPWFRGALTREAAEAMLAGKADGIFLVRLSSTDKNGYTLCVNVSGKVANLPIKPNGNMYKLGSSTDFPSVPFMIDYYRTNPLQVMGKATIFLRDA